MEKKNGSKKMIQTYTPIRGMIVCVSGGEYILYSDYLAEIAKKDVKIEGLEIKINHLAEDIKQMEETIKEQASA
jgi:hypothetical protein